MKAYAIKDSKGRVLPFTARLSESSCISDQGNSADWKLKYNRGYRCVPVLITEVKTDK